MTSLFNGIFQAYEKMEHQAINNILNGIMMLIFTLLVIYLNAGLIGIPIIYTLATLTSLIYILVHIKNITK